jgi:hypothetical protein
MAMEEFFITAIWPSFLWWLYAVLAAEALVERED